MRTEVLGLSVVAAAKYYTTMWLGKYVDVKPLVVEIEVP